MTLIPGDGIGPELAEAAKGVLEATGIGFDWDVQSAGEATIATEGTPLPDRVTDSIRRNGVALKGPITTPVGSGFRSVNVALRKALDLYAQVRPCKTYPGVRSRYEDVDLIVVRENTEDLYAGVEYEVASEDVRDLRAWIERHHGEVREDSGISIKPISVSGTRRIVEFAFDYAHREGRRKVTAVHKANIMKFTDGLFLRVAREVAEENPELDFEDRIVDNLAMQLVQRPEEYDVLVLPNLYGDIVSDLAAGLVGGLGLAPGGNINPERRHPSMFEPVHGSAPDIAGQGIANPIGAIWSGAQMLEHLGEEEAAAAVLAALEEMLANDGPRTRDLGGTATTAEVTAALTASFASRRPGNSAP